MAPQRQGPGLMGQMAATAVGVGVGSAIGHTIGAAMTGGMGGRSEPAPAQQDAAYGQQQQQQPYYASEQQQAGGGPCQWEMKQFVECAQNQYDITLCQGFNDALKQCRLNAGMPPQ
jgi:hypothetical protein